MQRSVQSFATRLTLIAMRSNWLYRLSQSLPGAMAGRDSATRLCEASCSVHVGFSNRSRCRPRQ